MVLGEKQLNVLLKRVGDTGVFEIPIFVQLKQPEEVHGLAYKINYEFKKRVKKGIAKNGSVEYGDELVRDDYEKKFSTKITFVDPNVAK